MVSGTEVFAPLADDYARYRPGYPAEVLDELARVCGLTHDWTIADIGCGPGNLARVFLEAGHQVVGVEPNREMREAGERLLKAYSAFRSLDGTAESIPLDSGSVDLITVAHALWWFDIDRARVEFGRILRPGGWVAVLWNDRPADTSAFANAYGDFTHYCASVHPSPASAVLGTRSGETDLACLFGSVIPHSASFPHVQSFDLEGLLGRARSSGYVPMPGEALHAELTAMLTDLFARNEEQGVVKFNYVAQMCYGRL